MAVISSHSAALYTVRVRGKGRRGKDDFREFGDLLRDGTRKSLTEVIAGYANELNVVSEDGLKDISSSSAAVATNGDLLISVSHGQRGISGKLIDPHAHLKTVVQSGDTQQVLCGVVLRLPATQSIGWMCLHVNNGRGIKSLLANSLIADFREDFPDLVLAIEPCQLDGVFREAVEQGHVEKVKLVKLVKPSDRAEYAIGDRWVSRDKGVQFDVDISSRGNWLQSGLIQRFWEGESSAWETISEFQGMSFDKVKVEVVVEGGQRRTFNIETPDAGHPITQDLLGLVFDENGAPTERSLFNALVATINDAAG